jgi:rhamnogalacturonan endolyase
VSEKSVSVNFRVYWNGDLQDELLDGNKLDAWNGNGTSRLLSLYNYGNSTSCNSSKATPNLQADLFGDWREEIILWDGNNPSTINIFTTNIPSDYRLPTLMHDHTYRMGVAWQNTAYNQPPHLGYYLPDFIESFQGNDPTGIVEIEKGQEEGRETVYNLMGVPVTKPTKGVYIIKGKKTYIK